MPRTAFIDDFTGWIEAHLDTHIPFIASLEGDPVGMAWLAIVERMPRPGAWARLCGHLLSVYVVDSHRNHGLGAELVDAVLAEARRRGLGYVLVHPSQRAVSLYRRAGFGESDLLKIGF